jgi:hypothetical protein
MPPEMGPGTIGVGVGNGIIAVPIVTVIGVVIGIESMIVTGTATATVIGVVIGIGIVTVVRIIFPLSFGR